MSALPNGYLSLERADSSETGARIPPFIYGTAWKGEGTARLVSQALEAGFTVIDTAAQPKHYREELVGEAVRRQLSQGTIQRGDLFLQTKFTPIDGQDLDRLPYQPEDSVADQIRSSVASSLDHLRTGSADGEDSSQPYLDCVLLHSPLQTLSETLIAWRTLEEFVPHRVRHLGISNVNLNNLELLYDLIDIKPAVVQNRFYPSNSYDKRLRRFCVDKGIIYQAFGTLTKNPLLLESAPVRVLAAEIGTQIQTALYCLVIGLKNMAVLNGTTNVARMKSDLCEFDRCRGWVAKKENEAIWGKILTEFETLIGGE